MNDGLSHVNAAAADETAGDSDDPAPRSADEPDCRDDQKSSDRRVNLEMETSECDPPAASWLVDKLESALDHLGLNEARLNMLIVDDQAMAGYHEQYCNIPGTTDVLTFDLREADDSTSEPAGDLLLCMDEARRQAAQRGHDVRDELLLYAVHGLMHLLGEDDHTDAGYAAMHAREDALLEAIGVGRVFAQHDHENKDQVGAGVNRAVP